jgi:hypothetical protein
VDRADCRRGEHGVWLGSTTGSRPPKHLGVRRSPVRKPVRSSPLRNLSFGSPAPRVGEGDLLMADVADREDLVDIELMDRIDHPRGSWSTGLAGNRNSNVVTSLGTSDCEERRQLTLPHSPPRRRTRAERTR